MTTPSPRTADLSPAAPAATSANITLTEMPTAATATRVPFVGAAATTPASPIESDVCSMNVTAQASPVLVPLRAFRDLNQVQAAACFTADAVAAATAEQAGRYHHQQQYALSPGRETTGGSSASLGTKTQSSVGSFGRRGRTSSVASPTTRHLHFFDVPRTTSSPSLQNRHSAAAVVFRRSSNASGVGYAHHLGGGGNAMLLLDMSRDTSLPAHLIEVNRSISSGVLHSSFTPGRADARTLMVDDLGGGFSQRLFDAVDTANFGQPALPVADDDLLLDHEHCGSAVKEDETESPSRRESGQTSVAVLSPSAIGSGATARVHQLPAASLKSASDSESPATPPPFLGRPMAIKCLRGPSAARRGGDAGASGASDDPVKQDTAFARAALSLQRRLASERHCRPEEVNEDFAVNGLVLPAAIRVTAEATQIAMPFVDGTTASTFATMLKERLPETTPDNVTAQATIIRNILGTTANGLSALHDLVRALHNDLTTSNVMVRTAGTMFDPAFVCGGGLDDDELRETAPLLPSGVVVDFGCAQVFADHEVMESTNFIGSVTFMSPERLAGHAAGPYGPAADIWSLGLVGLHLALGEYPFQAAFVDPQTGEPRGDRFWALAGLFAVGSSREEGEAAVNVAVHEAIARVSPRVLDDETRRVLLECLSFDPNHRPSAADVVHRLLFD